MVDQPTALPPPLPAAKPKSRRGLTIFIAICAAAILAANLIKIANSQNDLELVKQGAFSDDDGMAVEVTNVGHKPVTIIGMKVNDRDDCKAGPLTLGNLNFPVKLNVGDKQMFVSTCNIIRINVQTDGGTSSYSF
jgi:hypothetical protein